ncbi:unnamed protein product [Musa textilis]
MQILRSCKSYYDKSSFLQETSYYLDNHCHFARESYISAPTSMHDIEGPSSEVQAPCCCCLSLSLLLITSSISSSLVSTKCIKFLKLFNLPNLGSFWLVLTSTFSSDLSASVLLNLLY